VGASSYGLTVPGATVEFPTTAHGTDYCPLSGHSGTIPSSRRACQEPLRHPAIDLAPQWRDAVGT